MASGVAALDSLASILNLVVVSGVSLAAIIAVSGWISARWRRHRRQQPLSVVESGAEDAKEHALAASSVEHRTREVYVEFIQNPGQKSELAVAVELREGSRLAADSYERAVMADPASVVRDLSGEGVVEAGGGRVSVVIREQGLTDSERRRLVDEIAELARIRDVNLKSPEGLVRALNVLLDRLRAIDVGEAQAGEGEPPVGEVSPGPTGIAVVGPLTQRPLRREAEMIVTAPADPAIPRSDPGRLAVAAVAEWLREDRAAAEEHEKAIRADLYQHEMRRRMEAADRSLAEAGARVSALIDKHNVDGRRTLVFWLGSVIVVALVALDTIPLHLAAQTFDLNAAGNWLVTLILLLASIGSMAGLNAVRQDSRRYTVVAALTLTAYAGLIALCTSFLVTVAGEATAPALLRTVVLNAVSVGLVFLGSAVMRRTRSLRLSRALAAARRARRASQASEMGRRRAEENLERHLSVLHRQLVGQPLYSSVPAGLTHPEWVAVMERALRAQFTQR